MSNTLYFEDVEIGQCWISPSRTITETDVINFAGITGDFNPLHVNSHFASGTHFGQRIAHGYLHAGPRRDGDTELDDCSAGWKNMGSHDEAKRLVGVDLQAAHRAHGAGRVCGIGVRAKWRAEEPAAR